MRPKGAQYHHPHQQHPRGGPPPPPPALHVTTQRPRARPQGHAQRRTCCGLRCRLLSCMSSTSLREPVLVLVLVALASITITFHLGHRLHPLQAHEDLYDRLSDRGGAGRDHLNIHRSLHLSASAVASPSLSSLQRMGGGGGASRPSRGREEKEGDGGGGGGGGESADVGPGGGGGGGLVGSPSSGAVQLRTVLRVLQEVSRHGRGFYIAKRNTRKALPALDLLRTKNTRMRILLPLHRKHSSLTHDNYSHANFNPQ